MSAKKDDRIWVGYDSDGDLRLYFGEPTEMEDGDVCWTYDYCESDSICLRDRTDLETAIKKFVTSAVKIPPHPKVVELRLSEVCTWQPVFKK